jgi:predicted O-linked N-acetylglucosamine transferase (SPINDLY family)
VKNRVKVPESNRDLTMNRLLKIGYLSHSLRRHSVGWLARWLINYHNQTEYSVYIYHLHGENNEDDVTDFWYKNKAHSFYQLPSDIKPVIEQIISDQIDILIDLESLTSNIISEILAYKPVPIQVSWMGYDSSGLSTMDYMIADPYVLPENAQEYYQERIWRLPHTYLAVDGFEIFAPTLKRQDLDIPEDKIVYFSSQNGWKRNPENIKLQLEIIKNVSNSLLLLKGLGDKENMQQLFYNLAAEIGVDQDRLKFLPQFPCEEIYRANLQELADIVLDTYPYSGATTTLETLWLGIPIVTKVGQQWAARNSYAFMMNAGITEGIAWSDQEYIDWGITLGKDQNLRKEIAWKLRESKKTAPLWNAKQFTQEIEKAYRQMWEIYVNSSNN